MANRIAYSVFLMREVAAAIGGLTVCTRVAAKVVQMLLLVMARVLFSGYYLHCKSILRKEEDNACSKHLNIFHPECEGDVNNPKMFNLKVLQTFQKPLERKVAEAVLIRT